MTTTRRRVLLAVFLATVTLPITAYGIAVIPIPADLPGASDWVSPATEPIMLLVATAVAVITAAIAGSLVASRVRDGSAWVAWAVAVFMSWAAAIAALPVLPSLLGRRFDIGYWCIDSCNPAISARSPLAGIGAWAMSFVPGASVILMVGTPVGAAVTVVVAIGAIALARRGHGDVVLTMAVLGVLVVLHWYGIGQAPIPFAVLVLGAAAWTLFTRPAPGHRVTRGLAPPWAAPRA